MIETSVIVPAYGHCPHLPELLRALLEGDLPPGEIIVSHSGPGNPAHAVAAISREIVVLHRPRRLFVGAARNRGAALARGEWLAFIDSDVRPQPGWLAALLSSARAAPGRFVVGSVGSATSGGYWGICNWLSEFSEQAPWRPARVQAGGAGCSMLVSAEDFRAAGRFPSRFRAQDTAFFWQLRNLGHEQWFEPAARVDHHNHRGLAAFARHQFLLGYHSARARQRIDLPGSIATRYWPLAFGLWIPRFALICGRVAGGGPEWWLRGAGFAPGILLGTWIWVAGFLKRLVMYAANRASGRRSSARRPPTGRSRAPGERRSAS